MNYKPFPDAFWAETQKTLSLLKKEVAVPLVAAFDADGTLWDSDLGENFFQYQIDHGCVDLPAHAWNHYLELKKKNNDPREAYLWLAQINQGQTLKQVREWSQAAFDEIQPVPLFSEQKKLIDLFLQHHVQIYIVTASVTWAVETGARALGLAPENVIGVETLVQNNVISSEACLPITYRQGKADALLQKTKGIRPFFASGNTLGDAELMQVATHLRLAVSAASRDDKLFHSENELMKLAEKNKWFSHRFL